MMKSVLMVSSVRLGVAQRVEVYTDGVAEDTDSRGDSWKKPPSAEILFRRTNMDLQRLTRRIWYYPFEEERDRPNLGYIRGNDWSLAVDAGHSAEHVGEFYGALEREGLPLPSLTVLTHWHWDHTFGMHAVHGLCLAGSRTNACLTDFADRLKSEGTGFFLDMHSSIRAEYGDGRAVIVKPADIVCPGEVFLDAGSCPIRIFPAVSPHTDDCMLVEIPGEKVLFLGDACGGVFPTWEKDPAKCRELASLIDGIDAKICLEGHWTPSSKEETLQDLKFS